MQILYVHNFTLLASKLLSLEFIGANKFRLKNTILKDSIDCVTKSENLLLNFETHQVNNFEINTSQLAFF